MSRAIAAVLRDAAEQEQIPELVGNALPFGDDGDCAFQLVHEMKCPGYFCKFTNEERSAFLYLCSLMAEDEE